MAGQSQNLIPYFITIGAMIVVVTAIGVGLFVYRARLFRKNPPARTDAGSVLESLQRLRDQGRMSDEEFREARANIIAKSTGGRPGGQDARPKPAQPGEMRARPGFDLTGEPLPPRQTEDDAPGAG